MMLLAVTVMKLHQLRQNLFTKRKIDMLMMPLLKSLKMLMEIRSRKKEKFRMENTVETQEEAETIEEIIEEMIMEMTEEAESIEIEEATMKKEVIEVITEVTEVITREEKEDPIPDRKDHLTEKMMKVSMLFKTRTPKTEVEEDLEESTEETEEEIEETSKEEVKAEATIEVEVEAEMVKAPVEEIEAEVAEEEEKDHQESKPTQMKRVQELVLPLLKLSSSEDN